MNIYNSQDNQISKNNSKWKPDKYNKKKKRAGRFTLTTRFDAASGFISHSQQIIKKLSSCNLGCSIRNH